MIWRYTIGNCLTTLQIDLECPLKKGPMSITKEVQIPKHVVCDILIAS